MLMTPGLIIRSQMLSKSTLSWQGEVFECTTFILVLTPNTMMSVCCLESPLAGVRLQCPLEQV
jgi:hypothetical protein